MAQTVFWPDQLSGVGVHLKAVQNTQQRVPPLLTLAIKMQVNSPFCMTEKDPFLFGQIFVTLKLCKKDDHNKNALLHFSAGYILIKNILIGWNIMNTKKHRSRFVGVVP